MRNRLDVYETSTSPLIDYYRGCELLVTIDGDRDQMCIRDSTWPCPLFGARRWPKPTWPQGGAIPGTCRNLADSLGRTSESMNLIMCRDER